MPSPFIKTDFTYKSILLGTMASTYWKDIRYYYPDSTTMYICKNTNHKEPTVNDTWYVWKFTMNADGDVERTEGPVIGSVDKRTSLAWGA